MIAPSISTFQYHFTRDLGRVNRIGLRCIPTKEVAADILTKALPCVQYEYLAKNIGVL